MAFCDVGFQFPHTNRFFQFMHPGVTPVPLEKRFLFPDPIFLSITDSLGRVYLPFCLWFSFQWIISSVFCRFGRLLHPNLKPGSVPPFTCGLPAERWEAQEAADSGEQIEHDERRGRQNVALFFWTTTDQDHFLSHPRAEHFSTLWYVVSM